MRSFHKFSINRLASVDSTGISIRTKEANGLPYFLKTGYLPQSQSSVEHSVVVGSSWKLDASTLLLKMKSKVSSTEVQWNRRTWGTDLLLWRRLLAMSAMSMMRVSISLKPFSTNTGDESPLLLLLLQEDVSLDDAELTLLHAMDRRLVNPIFNFSIETLFRPQPQWCEVI